MSVCVAALDVLNHELGAASSAGSSLAFRRWRSQSDRPPQSCGSSRTRALIVDGVQEHFVVLGPDRDRSDKPDRRSRRRQASCPCWCCSRCSVRRADQVLRLHVRALAPADAADRCSESRPARPPICRRWRPSAAPDMSESASGNKVTRFARIGTEDSPARFIRQNQVAGCVNSGHLRLFNRRQGACQTVGF